MALKARDLILAGLVAFVAWGYATHWVPALRVAGHAFVAGAVLAVAAVLALIVLTSRGSAYGEIRSRRPKGVIFLGRQVWRKELRALDRRRRYDREPLYDESPRVSGALDDLLKLITRDFVQSWYLNISRDPVFPNEVDRAIRCALLNIRDRVFEVDFVEVLTSRLVPILTAHFRDFYDAERSVRGRKLNRSVTESEELDLAIASKYRDGKLHPAASLAYSDTKTERQEYLRKIVSRLLPQVLPGKLLASRPVATIIREIVTCAVLFPVMQILSDPDTWNQVMENYVCLAITGLKLLLIHRRVEACSKIALPSGSSALL